MSRMPSRNIELARAAWGATLLFAPRQVMKHAHPVQIDRKSVVVARILGARQLTQATLSGVRPSPEVLAMGVWVDAVHAMTALALAAIDRSRTRAGLADTAVATVWAAAGYRDLVAAGPIPTAHRRRRDQLADVMLGAAPGGQFLLRRVRTARHRFDWQEPNTKN